MLSSPRQSRASLPTNPITFRVLCFALFGLAQCDRSLPTETTTEPVSMRDSSAAVDAAEPTTIPSCGPAEMLCGDLCAAIDDDAHNCGLCGTNCGSDQICRAGRCVDAPSDLTPADALTR